MFFRGIVKRFFVCLLAMAALTLAACGSRQTGNISNVKPGEMPAGGEWSGVYYSPVYGYLHLIEEGNSVSGKWRTADGSAWGELHGTVNGNLLKYEWVEHKIGLVGPSATSKGRGYFQYTSPKAGEAHELAGEWGLKDAETGNGWKAVKQVNMRPDPESVMPDEIEGRTEAGGWDEEQNKPQPAPEEEESPGGDESGGDLE